MSGRWGLLIVVLLAAAGLAPGAAVAQPSGTGGDPMVHLEEILDRSPAPEYRRFGSPGMAAAADYAADVLAAAGYPVLRHDVPGTAYRVDYAPGHEPSLVRTADDRSFEVESAFRLEATTPAEGVTCVVRTVADVGPGDCGFVPFDEVSPEWTNLLADVLGPVDAVLAAGGVGVVLQGDVARDAVIAHQVRRPIPIVSAVATPGDLIGHEVRLRAMGGFEDATLHNVVAARAPADPSRGYVLVQGHLDGWFAAAADNAAGSAAVLAAAERLAGRTGGRGLLVALYDGEENGLLGSQALVEDLASGPGVMVGECGPTVRLHDIAAVVNLDASSARPSDVTGPIEDLVADLGLDEALGALGLEATVPLFSWRVHVFSEQPLISLAMTSAFTTAGALGLPMPAELATLINSGMNRTDARWFHEAGIPVAWPVAGYPEYHTSADTIETIDPTDLAAVADGAAALIRSLDDLPVSRLTGSSLGAPGSVPAPDPPAECVAGAAGGTRGETTGERGPDSGTDGVDGGAPTADGGLSGVTASSSHLGGRLPATGAAVPLLIGLVVAAAALGVRRASTRPR